MFRQHFIRDLVCINHLYKLNAKKKTSRRDFSEKRHHFPRLPLSIESRQKSDLHVWMFRITINQGLSELWKSPFRRKKNCIHTIKLFSAFFSDFARIFGPNFPATFILLPDFHTPNLLIWFLFSSTNLFPLYSSVNFRIVTKRAFLRS